MSIWMNPGAYSLNPFFLAVASFSSAALARAARRARKLPGAQTAQSFALQEPVLAGARNIRIDEAPGDDRQVIQGQFQQTGEFDDDQLLRGGERRMQGVVRPMRTVFRVFVSSSRRCHLDVVALLTL
jgi:hypothetical protein